MYNAIIDSPTSIKEIIPALYRGTKVNPRPYNVSCTENVYVEIKDEDVIFGAELPSLEVGTVSTREGPICPTAREVLKFIGIGTSKICGCSRLHNAGRRVQLRIASPAWRNVCC